MAVSRHFSDEENTNFTGVNLVLTQPEVLYQQLMSIYRHVSCVDVQWITLIQSIPQATDEQIRLLIGQKKEFPKVQEALELLLAGDGPYLEVLLEENTNDRFAHVVLAYDRTNGTRKIAICEFKQCRGINIKGCLIALGVTAGLVAYCSPAIGIVTLLGKIAVDIAASTRDVAVVAALKALQKARLIKITDNAISLE